MESNGALLGPIDWGPSWVHSEAESKMAQLKEDIKTHQNDRAAAKTAMEEATALREKVLAAPPASVGVIFKSGDRRSDQAGRKVATGGWPRRQE